MRRLLAALVVVAAVVAASVVAAGPAAAAPEMGRRDRLRWRSEEVLRALKRDGLGLDATQVRGPDKLVRLGALALGAARPVCATLTLRGAWVG